MSKDLGNDVQASISKTNQMIRDAIDFWADVMLTADADNWSYHLDYEGRDIQNVALIFQHVITNVGIKNGHITEENAAEFGKRIRQLVIDMTGYDTASIANEGKGVDNEG